MALLILPWTFRNYRAFGEVVPLNTNAGFALFWGNHPIHGTKFIPLLGNDVYADLIPAELLPLSEAQIDQELLRLGLQFIVDDPGRFITLSLSRAVEYFKFWPTADSSLISNISRVASFGLALPLMLAGLLLSTPLMVNPQFEQQRAQLVLLYLFILIYTGIHLASWTLIRYRLPVDAVLLMFAALTVTTIARRVRRQ